jgi:hypothetical protein
MPEALLKLDLSENAEIAYSSLNAGDRRLVDAWFEHLRNWHNDDYIRTHSQRLKTEGEVYAFPTSIDLYIAFEIKADSVLILSLLHEETVRKVKPVPEKSLP